MRPALLALPLTLIFAARAAAVCNTTNLADATATAAARKNDAQYSPRGTFQDCFLSHFGPDEKSDYESTSSVPVKEAFLYKYIAAAFDAAATVPGTSRAADYYRLAISAGDAYIELIATHPEMLSTDRMRDVLYRLGLAYYSRRDADSSAMQDLLYQYESIAASPAFGTRCFKKESIELWEKALRCMSGSCGADDAQLEAKIKAERATPTEFVQRCTSYAEFLTIACAETRFAALQPRKQKFNKFLQVTT